MLQTDIYNNKKKLMEVLRGLWLQKMINSKFSYLIVLPVRTDITEFA